jgi:DNA-binding LacI/PurR family transcriptional regulator
LKKIAFLIDYLYTATYQQEATKGIINALANREIEVYLFLGGPVNKDQYDPFAAYRNSIYALISKDVFDGIIMSTTINARTINPETLPFFDRYKGIPVAFFGPGPVEYPQVHVDSLKGMEVVVRHFIVDHGYKRIAFITGRLDRNDMKDRFTAYEEQLSAAGLPFDPELVCNSQFSRRDGAKAVSVLLDERKVRFDALIASTDLMALGAKQELEKRGYKIPTDIAIAGFDDITDAASVFPGLTTVKQPYNAIAEKVFQALEDQMLGREPIMLECVPGELVIRQSCGCMSSRRNDDLLAYKKSDETGADGFYANHRVEFRESVEALFSFNKTKIGKNSIESFLDSVYAEIAEEGVSGLTAMQDLLISNVKNKLNIDIWQDVLTLIRYLFSPFFTTRAIMDKAELFFQKARLMVCDFETIQKNQTLVSGWKQIDQISLVSETLSGTVETRELRDVIYSTFPSLSIKNFLFAEYFH